MMLTSTNSKIFEDDLRKMGASDEIINYVARNFLAVNKLSIDLDKVRRIKIIVSEHSSMYYDEEEDLFEIDMDTNKRVIAQERQKAMFFALRFTNLTLESIGSLCGNRDHSTVIHARKVVRNLFDSDPKYARDIKILDLKISEAIGRIIYARV